MYGFAQGPDQFGMMARMKKFGVGRIGDISSTSEQIFAQIKDMAEGEQDELIKAR